MNKAKIRQGLFLLKKNSVTWIKLTSDILKRMNRFQVHCWKKKRDFRIIRSKVGEFLTQSIADNEYFVGWKENMVDKYHQKELPIICECRLMFMM